MCQSLSSGLINKPFFVAVTGAIDYRLFIRVNHEGGHFYEKCQLPLRHKAYSCAFPKIFIDPFRCIRAGYVALKKLPSGLRTENVSSIIDGK